jgi:hypothetical protein
MFPAELRHTFAGPLIEGVGRGWTDTTAFTGVPGHPLATGMIEYVTVAGDGKILTSVCEIVFPEPFIAPIILPAGVTTVVQLKFVPDDEPDKAMLVVPDEQIACKGGVAVTLGIGLTVTIAVTGNPGQPFAIGVIVYVTVAGSEVVLVRVWIILFPLPAEAPVTLPCGNGAMVQEKLVLGVPLDNTIPVVPLEQITCDVGVAVIVGVGNKEIVTQPETAEQSTPFILKVTRR